MSLAVIQAEFCRSILDEDDGGFMTLHGIEPARIAIYRNAYRATMLGCLTTIFERTKIWVGDDAFEAAATDHIVRNPPISKSLDDYGAGFDETLARLFADDPEVAELAWIEWALHDNYCAADTTALTPATLDPALADPAAWDNARVIFVGDLILGMAATNIADIWPTIGNGEKAPDACLLAEPVSIAVWRRGYAPAFRTMPPDEFQAVAALRSGASFGRVCALLADHMGENRAAARAGALLARWLADGMINAIEVDA